ncbi:MAG: hypothetical protein BHW25_07175 [Faecalibacterium sp. CAG:82-related_59_9]|nr:MAG: hypothetical protein BHW25_07175 [Faecalibacterium sp. CAG:82-related_59_9]
MIFVPLLHYFKNKNSFSGNEDGMRYLLTPGKRKVPDPEGGEGAEKEESILTVDVCRAAAAKYLAETYEADPERWKQHPSLLDCEPWTPPAPEEEASGQS